MVSLLMLIKPPSSSSERRSGSRHWSFVQQEELTLQALATLATIAPLMLDDFMSYQGNTCLLVLLDWCVTQGEEGARSNKGQTRAFTHPKGRARRKAGVVFYSKLGNINVKSPLLLENRSFNSTRVLLAFQSISHLFIFVSDSYFGQGHSFHSTGGRGSKKAQMRHCIRVLRSVTSSGEESVIQDFCDQGLISQLLGKLETIMTYKEVHAERFDSDSDIRVVSSAILMQMEASPDEEDVITLEIKSDLQLILSALCESDMHRKVSLWPRRKLFVTHILLRSEWKTLWSCNPVVLLLCDDRSCLGQRESRWRFTSWGKALTSSSVVWDTTTSSCPQWTVCGQFN